MPVSGPIPEQVLAIAAAATVFTVMFTLGLGIALAEFRSARHEPWLIAKGLFSVLVAVPAIAVVVARAFDLARPVEIGIVLMAISPGAPVALRNALAAGGHRSFAPALQILVALLAAFSMPLSIALLDEVYAGSATIAPGHVARQVFTAQLLPLSLGILLRTIAPATAIRIRPAMARLGGILLLILVVLAVIDIWDIVVDAGPRAALAIASVTALALGVGHRLGGPDEGTSTAVAISSAARNPGLALLVATLNGAEPAITRTVLAYLIVSAATIVPYVIWRGRARPIESHRNDRHP